jgi:hypothetical protein
MNEKGMIAKKDENKKLFSHYNFFEKNRKGQVTIFIIIAIIIVAVAVLIYSFYPQIKTSLSVEEQNPISFIQSCIEEDINSATEIVSKQGGSIAPENYLLYDNSNVEYLCYTLEYLRPCVVQQAMLKQHIESEIKNQIEGNVDACFDSMKSNYEKQGYSVDLKEGDKKIELLPKRVIATFNYSLTLTKGEDTQRYDSFMVMINNNLYELVSIANSIIEWEATYGDAETTTYMTLYHDLKVEKDVKGDSGKVYILTDRNTGNKFQFAIRGQVWPAGYAVPVTE